MESKFARAQRFLIVLLVFFVVLAIFPLTPEPAGDIKVLGYELYAFPALLLWLFTPRHSWKTLLRSSAFFFLLTVFVVLNLAAVPSSLNVGYSLFREFTKIASLYIVFIVATDAFHTPKQVWNLVAAICCAVSIASLYGVIQFLGWDPFPWLDKTAMLREAPATFGNPNFASHTLAPTLILTAGLCFQPRRRWFVFGIALFLCHFVLTQTRGSLTAVASAVVIVLAALVISRKMKNSSHAVALTFGIVCIAGIIGIAAVATVTRITQGQPYPFDKGDSITLRYHSFYGASRLVQESPWRGHGPGMYQVVSPKHWTLLEKERFKESSRLNDHVHNELLEVAVDAGLPASIVYAAILLLGMYYGLSLWFAPRNSEMRSLGLTLAAFYMCFFVDGLFGFNLHVPVSAVLLFLMTGATAGILREHQNPSPQFTFPCRCSNILWRSAVLIPGAIIFILGIREFSALLLHQRGLGAMEQKFYPAAAELFEDATALAPFDWTHSYYLGMAAKESGDPKKAADYFKRTLFLNPYSVHAQINLAETLLGLAVSSSDEKAQALLTEVVHYAESVIRINPLLSQPHGFLAEVYFLRAKNLQKSGETNGKVAELWQEAEDYAKKAIELGSKQEYKLWKLIAEARLEMEDVPSAGKALIQSLKDTPTDMGTWRLFLRVSNENQEYASILASLDRHIQLLSSSQSSVFVVGTLHLMRAQVLLSGYGDESGAEEAFLSVLDKDIGRIDAWAEFHAFAKSTGREQQFNASLVRLTDRQNTVEPHLPLILQAVGLGLGEGEASIAAGVSKFVEALAEEQAVNRRIEEVAKRFSWAADILAERAKQTPLLEETAGSIFFTLGIAYGAVNDFGATVEMFDCALPHLPRQQQILCLMRKADALTRLGKTEAVVITLEEARAIDPNDLDVWLALVGALNRDGQIAKAKEEYRMFLDESVKRQHQQSIQQKPAN